jgi:hypothetical protein
MSIRDNSDIIEIKRLITSELRYRADSYIVADLQTKLIKRADSLPYRSIFKGSLLTHSIYDKLQVVADQLSQVYSKHTYHGVGGIPVTIKKITILPKREEDTYTVKIECIGV